MWDAGKSKTVSSHPTRGKDSRKGQLWSSILGSSWLQTALRRREDLRATCWSESISMSFRTDLSCRAIWAVGAHCLLRLIKRSLYHGAFGSALNGFSRWLWFLTWCSHLIKIRRPQWAGKGVFIVNSRSAAQVFPSLLLWDADQLCLWEASACWAEAAPFKRFLWLNIQGLEEHAPFNGEDIWKETSDVKFKKINTCLHVRCVATVRVWQPGMALSFHCGVRDWSQLPVLTLGNHPTAQPKVI